MKHFNHLLDYNLEISPCFDFYGTDRQNNYRFTMYTKYFNAYLKVSSDEFSCYFKPIPTPMFIPKNIWDTNNDEQEVDAYLEAKQLEFEIGKAIKTGGRNASL